MKSTPTPRAWQSDPYWTEVVDIIASGKKLRPDHYLEGLSAEELDELRSVLSASGSFAQQRLLCPKRRGGSTDGSLPNISTLSEIAQAMRQQAELSRLQTHALIEAAAKKRCGDLGLNTSVTNAVVHIVGEEALRQHAFGTVGDFSLKAAQVLMKREAQKLDERKLALLEKKAAQLDKVKEVVAAQLSPEEQKQRLKEILK